MTFLSWLGESGQGWQKPLRQALDSVMTRLTAVSGHSLNDFFRAVGSDLATRNVGLVFLYLDDREGRLTIKSSSLPRIFDEGHLSIKLRDRELDLAGSPDYLRAWREKRPIWLEFNKSVVSQAFDYDRESPPHNISSIVVPLVVSDTPIGLIEYFAIDLKRSDVDDFEAFSRELAHSLVDYLLFGEIKKTEERYRLLFAEAGEGFAVVDGTNSRIVKANKNLAELTGINTDELVGMDYRRLFDPQEKLTIERLVAACTLGRDKSCVSRMEAGLVGRNGAKSTVQLTINQIGQTREYLFIFNDITAQKQADEEIRRLNEFNQRIFDSSPISILVIDREGGIIAANDHARRLMSDSYKKLIGLKLTETKGFKGDDILKGMYANLLENGAPIYFDNLSYHEGGDGETRHLNLIAVPLLDADGRIEGAISMALDNTEVIHARERLENLNRELEKMVSERTAALDKANRRLNEALELKLKFIADASHELRTPLTVLQGNIEMAVKEAKLKDEELPEVYPLALQEIGRMSRIISDLTMLTNIDSEGEKLRFEPVDIHHLLRTACGSLKVLADQKAIRLDFEGGPKPVIYEGDESWLEKLFLNLIRNAIKYSNQHGRVKVTLQQDESAVTIAVSDRGIGIPEEDRGRIFERFYRVDKSRSRHEGGTGLGLAIAKWVAETHGGGIKVESELGKGSTFTVNLPKKPKA